jgi:hypothetical protein
MEILATKTGRWLHWRRQAVPAGQTEEGETHNAF